MRLIPLLACLILAACTDVRAQSERLVPRVDIAADEATPESIDAERPPLDPCLSPAELGYKAKRLAELSLDIQLKANLMPADCSAVVFQGATAGTERDWLEMEFNWVATDLFHQPAYFDDPILERYGQSHGHVIQPILSGAHFFSQFPLIPYKIGLDRTHDHIYTLGYYRPGTPMPLLGRRLPLEADAAGLEAMGWVALFLVLP